MTRLLFTAGNAPIVELRVYLHTTPKSTEDRTEDLFMSAGRAELGSDAIKARQNLLAD